jgi:hypothetical protein
MTKLYHLTQEQALSIRNTLVKTGVINALTLPIQDTTNIINAALDKVLGEPVGEVVGEGNNFAYVLNKRLPKDTKLYAPKELT